MFLSVDKTGEAGSWNFASDDEQNIPDDMTETCPAAGFVLLSETERCEASRPNRESWSEKFCCDGSRTICDDKESGPEPCFVSRQNRRGRVVEFCE